MRSLSPLTLLLSLGTIVLLTGACLWRSIGHTHLAESLAARQLQPADLQQVIPKLLSDLPRPMGTLGKPEPIFHAASFGQTLLNFQAEIGAPDTEALAYQVVAFYRCELAGIACEKPGLGYEEREVNTIVAQWGFSLVFDPPQSLNLSPKDSTKRPVLVLQGVVLNPHTINISLRYEEV